MSREVTSVRVGIWPTSEKGFHLSITIMKTVNIRCG